MEPCKITYGSSVLQKQQESEKVNTFDTTLWWLSENIKRAIYILSDTFMKYKNGQMTNSLAKLLIYMPTPGRVGQLTILKFHDIHFPHFLGTDCHLLLISN